MSDGLPLNLATAPETDGTGVITSRYFFGDWFPQMYFAIDGMHTDGVDGIGWQRNGSFFKCWNGLASDAPHYSRQILTPLADGFDVTCPGGILPLDVPTLAVGVEWFYWWETDEDRRRNFPEITVETTSRPTLREQIFDGTRWTYDSRSSSIQEDGSTKAYLFYSNRPTGFPNTYFSRLSYRSELTGYDAKLFLGVQKPWGRGWTAGYIRGSHGWSTANWDSSYTGSLSNRQVFTGNLSFKFRLNQP